MPRRKALGPNAEKIWTTPPEHHPVLSAVLFEEATKRHGGASMDINTGEVLDVGSSDVVLVGGEKDASGKRIPTNYYGRTRAGSPPRTTDFNFTTVMKERLRLRNLTKDRPGAVLGSYVSPEEPHKGVQIDAAAGITDRSKVLPTLQARNEEAGFDLKAGSNIMNPYYKPKGKKN